MIPSEDSSAGKQRLGHIYSPLFEFGSYVGQLVTGHGVKTPSIGSGIPLPRRGEFEEVILVEVLIEEMFGSERSRPTDYERAVVVGAEENEQECSSE